MLPWQPHVLGPLRRNLPGWPQPTGPCAQGSGGGSCSPQAERPSHRLPSAALFLLSQLKLAFVLFCFNNLNIGTGSSRRLAGGPMVTLSTCPGCWLS